MPTATIMRPRSTPQSVPSEQALKAQYERGVQDGLSGILPEETGKSYMTGFREGRHLRQVDPMRLWRAVNLER